MKRIAVFFRLTAVLLSVAVLAPSCTSRVILVKTHHPGPLPPGQQKKITGQKSARPYAPGQQKKGR